MAAGAGGGSAPPKSFLNVEALNKVCAIPDPQRNAHGSSSGAGSGDFHEYRNGRRREQDRLETIEKDAKAAAEQAEFLKRKAEREAEVASKSAKKSEKRKKKKMKNKEKQQQQAGAKKPRPDGSGAADKPGAARVDDVEESSEDEKSEGLEIKPSSATSLAKPIMAAASANVVAPVSAGEKKD